jgi:transposase
MFNPRYLDFARHHGFEIVACNVGRGNEKGRVESGVGYVKKNFLRGLELSEFSAMQAAAQVWLDTVANVRIHGETQRRPIDKAGRLGKRYMLGNFKPLLLSQIRAAGNRP